MRLYFLIDFDKPGFDGLKGYNGKSFQRKPMKHNNTLIQVRPKDLVKTVKFTLKAEFYVH